ncbi:MAG TPA: hypothetical protein VGQ62_16655, partial [Chloroflexota bacterium]|nr:hypothetical protein [Chloroflexota bacterium]
MAISSPYAAADPSGGSSGVAAATEDELHELFLDSGWTDGLPIVLPTDERVAAMLAGSSHAPGEHVGALTPSAEQTPRAFTVRDVAVNAVMAGAWPNYLPVILAVAASGVSARDGHPSSGAAMVVINGPIRLELEMNAGIGAMGPYNHANSTIGRAYGLLSQNLQGGSVPGKTYFGSQGNNYAFSSITFPENEERSPWQPFHVEHGFTATDSAVSVFSSCRHNTFTLGLRETHWRTHVQRMLFGMDPAEDPMFVLDPIAARQFVERGGFDTRAKLVDWVYETARYAAGDYWGFQRVKQQI